MRVLVSGHGCAVGVGRPPPQRSRGMATRSLYSTATSAARERMLIPRVSVRMRWCSAALKPRAWLAAYSTVCMRVAAGGLKLADKWPYRMVREVAVELRLLLLRLR